MQLASAVPRILTGEVAGKAGARRGHQPGMTRNQTDQARPCLRAGAPVDVRTWRRCRLLEAGFGDDLATRLAGMPQVDLHALLQLVDRGCPPHLAARILAPLDADGWSS